MTSQEYSGKLIVVEGLDGSGKSTQIYLLKRWLEMQKIKVFFTEWNSSSMVKTATSKGKKRQLLTPTTFSLIHATDFADRYEQEIWPLLRAGYIVLADRYIYTAYVRDITRGCSPEWVRNLYAFALKPDIAFYFDVPLNTALDRILSGRPELKYFEAGMDLNLSTDIQESFRLFQKKIHDQYQALVSSEGLCRVDASRQIHEQQVWVRNYVSEKIDLASFRRLDEAAE
jgi:dTMP kinase